MSGIAGAVEEMLLAALLSEKVLTSGRTRTETALCALGAAAALAGVFFLGLSVFRHLENLYAPDVSAFAASGAAFAAAAVLALAAGSVKHARRSRVGAITSELRSSVRGVIGEISQELEGPVAENPKLAMLVALIAGYALADHHTRH